MRPEDALCEGHVNEATLLAKIPHDLSVSLATYALALATGGDWVTSRSFQLEVDRVLGRGFCEAVAALREPQAERRAA